MSLRLSIAAAAVAAASVTVAPAGSAAQRASAPQVDWAAPQIGVVISKGLMGASTPAAFRPAAPLTAQALENLVFGLKTTLAPPVPVVPAVPGLPGETPPLDGPGDAPTPTDGSGETVPTATAPTDTTPGATTPGVTTPGVTTPGVTTPGVTTTTPTATTPVAPAPPATPAKVADPTKKVTMAQLDARLVASLGLSGAASEFGKAMRAAGLRTPGRFGTEVVARLLGLRLDHPANEDSLELLPTDPATRAEAAYSAAQMLGFGFGGWQVAAVQSLADSFTLPQLSAWQTRILDTAVSKIGMPYIWGGTSDGPEAPFGVHSRGGYDCSGFVWRVYKLQSYPDERNLASVLRGRTTYEMSAEVPRAERLGFADLQPGDVIFFGDRGPSSQPAEVGHMGIYVGNGWFIHSSGYGVALATLTGWYRDKFAWARRPLREAGLAG